MKPSALADGEVTAEIQSAVWIGLKIDFEIAWRSCKHYASNFFDHGFLRGEFRGSNPR